MYDLVTKQAFLPRHDHRRRIRIVLFCGLRILLVASLGEIGTNVSVERDPQVLVPVLLDPMDPVVVPGVHGTNQGGPDPLTLADPPVNDRCDPRPPGSEQRHRNGGCPFVVVVNTVVISMGSVAHTVDTIFSIQLIRVIIIVIIIVISIIIISIIIILIILIIDIAFVVVCCGTIPCIGMDCTIILRGS